MSVTKLEQTLIDSARAAQAGAVDFYRLKAAGKAHDDDYSDYLSHYHALTAIVSLAHSDSGLSLEAARQLLDIEDAEASAYRENSPAEDNPLRRASMIEVEAVQSRK